jgi:hypothetical protein
MEANQQKVSRFGGTAIVLYFVRPKCDERPVISAPIPTSLVPGKCDGVKSTSCEERSKVICPFRLDVSRWQDGIQYK